MAIHSGQEFPDILEVYDNPNNLCRELYYEGELVSWQDKDLIELMHKYIGQPAWGTYNKPPRNKLLQSIGAHPQASDVPFESSDESPSD